MRRPVPHPVYLSQQAITAVQKPADAAPRRCPPVPERDGWDTAGLRTTPQAKWCRDPPYDAMEFGALRFLGHLAHGRILSAPLGGIGGTQQVDRSSLGMITAMSGKQIKLFLVDGTPGGLTTAEITNWTGHVLARVGPTSPICSGARRLSGLGSTSCSAMTSPSWATRAATSAKPTW